MKTKLKLLVATMLIATSCFSQSGIYQLNTEIRALDKIINNNNDTLIVINSDMLLEINKLIIKEQVQQENIDSLARALNRCSDVVVAYSKIVDNNDKEIEILKDNIDNRNKIIQQLERKNKIYKIKSYTFGVVTILAILKLLI